jgi:hypothetical protein
MKKSHTAILLFLACALGMASPAAGATAVDAATANAERRAAALQGPLAGVERVVFATRTDIRSIDYHWYANIGYFADGPQRPTYGKEGRLCVLELRTGKLTLLVDDPAGAVRDPVLDYDAKRILFSYRKGGTEHYLMHTINVDGTGLTRLSDDAGYDDYEPCWLPDGDIIFVTTRARRWVPCWHTQVGNIWRCDANGRSMRPLSVNVEQDNTPWVMPDGRIMYTRWEYINRSQMLFHHLWTMNPDGTGQMTWFGNMNPDETYLDAKMIPGTDQAIFTWHPHHGAPEHMGRLATVHVRNGPDDKSALKLITPNDKGSPLYRDPWPLNASLFMAARDSHLVLVDDKGVETILYSMPREFRALLNEPRPIVPRPREPVIPSRVDLTQDKGRFLVQDVHIGRKMAGVKPGEIKRMMVIEVLPKPISSSGGGAGQFPLSHGGSFNLERVLGTVPVESDGSAYFEAPALKPLLFVTLDEKNRAVKRMQSFTTVQPGETFSCIGCHENRTGAPSQSRMPPIAARRAPSRIEAYPDIPQVFDFPRHIQPILDKNCISCHDSLRRDGGISLSGARGPVFSHAYIGLLVKNQLSDGRNHLGNMAPYAFGSSGSHLMGKIIPAHHGVALSEREQLYIRLWLDAGATFAGNHGAIGAGQIGGYWGAGQEEDQIINNDSKAPATLAAEPAIVRRCDSCHDPKSNPIPRSLSDDMRYSDNQVKRSLRSRHLVFNLTDPEKSLFLLAPLAKEAGGLGICTGATAPVVLAKTDDPDYRLLLGMIEAGKRKLEEVKRFDMPGYRPPVPYLREMKRYGVLPDTFDLDKDPADPYELDLRYYDSLKWKPVKP